LVVVVWWDILIGRTYKMESDTNLNRCGLDSVREP
jgi:hypothetical protein